MPDFKVTMRINWGTTRGWSESFYLTLSSATAPSAVARILGFATRRANVLTGNAVIIDAIISQEGTPGVAVVQSLNLPGNLGSSSAPILADVPMVCQQVNLRAGSTARRQYLLRGLPDGDVQGGFVTWASSGFLPISSFIGGVSGTADAIKIKDRSLGATQLINSVDGDGEITLAAAAAGLATGDYVYIRSQTVGNGPRITTVGRVKQTPAGTQVVVSPWTWGTAIGGTLRKLTYTYSVVDFGAILSPNIAKSRKTGRPFGGPRGRRPTTHVRRS